WKTGGPGIPSAGSCARSLPSAGSPIARSPRWRPMFRPKWTPRGTAQCRTHGRRTTRSCVASMPNKVSYGTAILHAFEYLLERYPECFVIGQGLWSPWYVGNSMQDLDKKFGKNRIIDTPVSEAACTGAAVGAALAGMKPIVVHPRMDFMLYAMD